MGIKATIPKIFLGSSPDEDSFFSSETKHDRTVPRPESFALTGRLQDQRKQPWKSVLDSSPGEDDFSSSVTKEDRTFVNTCAFVEFPRSNTAGTLLVHKIVWLWFWFTFLSVLWKCLDFSYLFWLLSAWDVFICTAVTQDSTSESACFISEADM
jgi:hypothetical protein